VRTARSSKVARRRVRGEMRIPNFKDSSLATRCSPQVGLSRAIWRKSAWIFFDYAGRPFRFDFQRQRRRNPSRCQGIRMGRFDDHKRIAPHEAPQQRQTSASVLHRLIQLRYIYAFAGHDTTW
jgi:hypothetical protein